MNQQKHIHLARRKMSHVIDELYTALLLAGGKRVTLEITKEPEAPWYFYILINQL